MMSSDSQRAHSLAWSNCLDGVNFYLVNISLKFWKKNNRKNSKSFFAMFYDCFVRDVVFSAQGFYFVCPWRCWSSSPELVPARKVSHCCVYPNPCLSLSLPGEFLLKITTPQPHFLSLGQSSLWALQIEHNLCCSQPDRDPCAILKTDPF